MDHLRLKLSVHMGGDRVKLLARLRPQPTSEFYRLQGYFRDPTDILNLAPFSERFILALRSWFIVMLRERFGVSLSNVVFGCPPLLKEPFPFYEFVDIRKQVWRDVASDMLSAADAYYAYEPGKALQFVLGAISKILISPPNDWAEFHHDD